MPSNMRRLSWNRKLLEILSFNEIKKIKVKPPKSQLFIPVVIYMFRLVQATSRRRWFCIRTIDMCTAATFQGGLISGIKPEFVGYG